MLSTTDRFGSYLELIGLAAARTDVRALSEQMMPAYSRAQPPADSRVSRAASSRRRDAFATETVCCSIASCRMERAPSDILSNSSMQQTPWSDSTSAPDSSTNCLVSGSFVTYAVRPTADEPLPEV